MTSIELIDKKELLKKQLRSLIATAEKEARELTAEEEEKEAELIKEIEETDEELRELEEENKKAQEDEENEETEEERKSKKNNRNMKKFSLLKAINDVANNRPLDERAMEVVNAGIKEMRRAGVNYSGQIILPTEARDIQATVATKGKENVPTDKLSILEPLRANIVFDALGATMMTGLVGDVSIPVFSGNNVTWEGEVAAAKNGEGTFTEVKLAPKRLTAYVDVSKQFLIQDSNSAEEMLKRDIVNAINDKLQATVFGSGAGSTTEPKGMFASLPTGAAPTFASVVAMEQALEEKNVTGDIKFLLSPAAKAALKTTPKDAGSGIFLMEGNEVNGYQAVSTSSVVSGAYAMGKFDDLVVAQWGSVDLTVDPYTQAANGKVRLVINAYFDAVIRRADSFVTATTTVASK